MHEEQQAKWHNAFNKNRKTQNGKSDSFKPSFCCAVASIWAQINPRLSNENVKTFSIFHSLNVVGRLDRSPTTDMWRSRIINHGDLWRPKRGNSTGNSLHPTSNQSVGLLLNGLPLGGNHVFKVWKPLSRPASLVLMKEYDQVVDQSQVWCTCLASSLKFGRLW